MCNHDDENNRVNSANLDVSSDASNSFIDSTTYNIHQDIITITEDRLKLKVKDFLESLVSFDSLWGLVLTVLSLFLTILTAEFKDTFGISKEYWSAIFVVLLIISILYVIYKSYKLYNKRKSVMSIEAFINSCKKK